jgi:TolB-like protein/class 3 adenylate cyclase
MSDNTTLPIRERTAVEPTTAAPATRRLAAILLADVVGYSGMMSRDEDGTHARVAREVRQMIDLNIIKHGGRFVRSMGDGTLVVFASALDAVRCGLDIQRGLGERQTDGSDRVRLRIGINTGDVLADDRDIYGNSVNIAARLQTLATPGRVYVSHSIYDQTRSHPDLFFADRGQHRVKNIPYPLHVFEVAYKPIRVSILARLLRKHVGLVAMMMLVAALGAPVSTMLVDRNQKEVIGEVQAPAPLPDKRSIAVLPFLNIGSDPEQEYFSDGMTEDLITELSSLAGLFVIARNSVYTFKGRAVKAEQVSRELGVRYVVEGSVRKANNQVRITAQLIDANTGYDIWAQYYDRDLQDVFAVQGEIARRITSALAVKLTKDEENHMGRPYTSSEVAWEYFMRGAELFRRFTPKDNANARDLFEKAIGLDPKFARAYAILAATHRQDYYGRWTQDPESSEDLAYRMARKAVELARSELDPKPSLPFALEQMGWVLLYRGQHEEARQKAEELVRRNPNYADGYALWAQVLVYSGKPEEALDKSQEAIDHNPKYPFFYDYHRGQAYYVWGVLTSAQDLEASRQRFVQAETYLREALRKNNNFRPARSYLVAVLSELGEQGEAVKEMNISLEKGEPWVEILKSGDQKLANEQIRTLTPYANPEIRSRLADAWRKAVR